jgi:hypothetical protein
MHRPKANPSNSGEMNSRSPSYTSVPLSTTQKGAIGQFAFLATSLATGKGELEVYSPAADNEGRDAEIRRHLKPALAIGIQEKVTFETFRSSARSRAMSMDLRFSIVEDRVQNDPRLWYFFALWGSDELRLHDPCFLVPAHVFHVMGRKGKRNGEIDFLMQASLAPDSHDRWSPFRVAPKDLGPRLLEIVDKAGLMATSLLPHLPAEALLVGRAIPRAKIRLGAASADPKYDLLRNAVLERDCVSAWYQGKLRLFSPVVLGTKAGEPHLLGYQFGGTSRQPLGPDGSPRNWRCLRVSELTDVNLIPGVWHTAGRRKGVQNCIDQVDVSAGRPSSAKPRLRRAA